MRPCGSLLGFDMELALGIVVGILLWVVLR
jgi:hypothetical protein